MTPVEAHFGCLIIELKISYPGETIRRLKYFQKKSDIEIEIERLMFYLT